VKEHKRVSGDPSVIYLSVSVLGHRKTTKNNKTENSHKSQSRGSNTKNQNSKILANERPAQCGQLEYTNSNREIFREKWLPNSWDQLCQKVENPKRIEKSFKESESGQEYSKTPIPKEWYQPKVKTKSKSGKESKMSLRQICKSQKVQKTKVKVTEILPELTQ
jgi:hypothetical protein